MADLKLQEGDRFPVEHLPSPLTKRTIVFFYPAAMTGGCTREARRFNDLLGDFKSSGVDVLGASVDAPELNDEFCDKEGLKFQLVSDPGKELAGELGLLEDRGERGMIAARYTYLLDPDGTILKIWEVAGGEAIDVHPDEVLSEVQTLAA